MVTDGRIKLACSIMGQIVNGACGKGKGRIHDGYKDQLNKRSATCQ